jgi:serine/threonine protein kinase
MTYHRPKTARPVNTEQLRTLWQPVIAAAEPAAASDTLHHDSSATRRSRGVALPSLATLAAPPAAPKPEDSALGPLSAEGEAQTMLSAGSAEASTPTERHTVPTDSAGAPHFELIGEIARGGMGAIFRGLQHSLDREVAVKKALQASSEDARERFVAEARVTAFLEHPNIVPVHELGSGEDGNFLLVMKLIGGRSWSDALEARNPANPIDIDSIIDVLLKACDAIAYAHSRGIIHCDIKPENIMVGEFGEVLVMDWGVAVDAGSRSPAEARGLHRSEITGPMGTPNYMAPELVGGQGDEIGPHTDVYLLGATLYDALAGHPPHGANDLWDVVAAAAENAPPPLPRNIPLPLRAICARAMATEPAERYPDVAALQAALRSFRAERETRTFLSICAGFVALLAILGAFVGLLLHNETELNREQEIRHQSYATAMELQHSSDKLTSAARAYVMTSDPVYEDRYWQVLAILDGEAPRPDGTKISLGARMKELGFSKREFDLLDESKAQSNALVEIEETAMHAIKGEFRDEKGEFTIRKAPDRELARTLMFGDAYADAQGRISAPIRTFVRVLDARTAEAVQTLIDRSYLYLGIIMAILATLVGAAVMVTLRLFRRVRA